LSVGIREFDLHILSKLSSFCTTVKQTKSNDDLTGMQALDYNHLVSHRLVIRSSCKILSSASSSMCINGICPSIFNHPVVIGKLVSLWYKPRCMKTDVLKHLQVLV